MVTQNMSVVGHIMLLELAADIGLLRIVISVECLLITVTAYSSAELGGSKPAAIPVDLTQSCMQSNYLTEVSILLNSI
jgi:hypothetical protein